MHLEQDVQEFLNGRWIARVTTMGPDGYPHTVPVWYMVDGDDIVISTGRGARKIRNAQQNPKGSIVIGGDPKEEYIDYHPAILLQGDFTFEPDPADGYEWLRKIAFRYRDDHDAVERDIHAWGPHDVLRLRVKKVVRIVP